MAAGSEGQEAAAPLVEARGIGVRFGAVVALEGVDLAVEPGRIVTVIGPNGSGKTTLVRALLGLQPLSAGEVRRAPGLAVGYVPQHVRIDETLPLTAARFLALGGRRSRERITAALEEVGVPGLAARPMHGLSGGETRRVLLARALLRDPDLLVLDEPTAGVDIGGQTALYKVIQAIRDRRGCGVLLVSHDLSLVMAATDHVVCLNRHVCCQGRPGAVAERPEYQALFGPEAAAAMAVYAHQHDHRHDLAGAPVTEAGGGGGAADGDDLPRRAAPGGGRRG